MTIDLSQFVDKEVLITLRNGSQCKVYIQEYGVDYFAQGEYLDDHFSYFCHYSKNGLNGLETDTSLFDIIKIEHTYTKPMTIDLSQFVDKEVLITLRNGEEYVTTIRKQKTGNITYPYYFVHSCGDSISYTCSGIHDLNTIYELSQFDIIKIKLRNPEPMTESLKCETLKGITKSLIPELIPFVESHEKYAEVMYQLFDEFLQEKFGDMKPEVKGEIACMFMDSISFRSV